MADSGKTVDGTAHVLIRAAQEGDFDFVSNLMTEYLAQWYGGDHVAHARRIFDKFFRDSLTWRTMSPVSA